MQPSKFTTGVKKDGTLYTLKEWNEEGVATYNDYCQAIADPDNRKDYETFDTFFRDERMNFVKVVGKQLKAAKPTKKRERAYNDLEENFVFDRSSVTKQAKV